MHAQLLPCLCFATLVVLSLIFPFIQFRTLYVCNGSATVGYIVPHQLTSLRQPPTDMPSGQHNVDSSSLRLFPQVTLSCV